MIYYIIYHWYSIYTQMFVIYHWYYLYIYTYIYTRLSLFISSEQSLFTRSCRSPFAWKRSRASVPWRWLTNRVLFDGLGAGESWWKLVNMREFTIIYPKNGICFHQLIQIWLLVWNIWIIFPYIGNNNPNCYSLIFFRGVGLNHQKCYGQELFPCWNRRQHGPREIV